MKAVVIGLAFAALAAGSSLAAENGVGDSTTAAPAPTAPAFRVGLLIKDDKGAALGRVTRVVKATATEPAKVIIRIGDANHTVLQTQVVLKDGVPTYTPDVNAKSSLPFQAGW
jgi:hypothetical protein